MRKQEEGFTLIELVIVLVILGILAAVAIPRFEDFSGQAQSAATSGGVSSVASAIAIETAKNGAAGSPAADSVVSRLPGSACTDLGTKVAIQISGQGTNRVLVTLVSGAGADAIAACTTATVAGVGSGNYLTS